MSFPSGVPLTRVTVRVPRTAFEEPASAGVADGWIIVNPDHDRVILGVDPPLYVDDVQRRFPLSAGGFTAVSSDCPNTTWDNVRYAITLEVTLDGKQMTLPSKTLFLPSGTLSGGSWSTPELDYFLTAPDAGTGSVALGGALSDIQLGRTPWQASTVYPLGANVVQAGAFYTAVRAVPARSSFTLSDGWWLTGYDQDTV